jgi:hypothetical protein
MSATSSPPLTASGRIARPRFRRHSRTPAQTGVVSPRQLLRRVVTNLLGVTHAELESLFVTQASIHVGFGGITMASSEEE